MRVGTEIGLVEVENRNYPRLEFIVLERPRARLVNPQDGRMRSSPSWTAGTTWRRRAGGATSTDKTTLLHFLTAALVTVTAFASSRENKKEKQQTITSTTEYPATINKPTAPRSLSFIFFN